MGGMGRGTAEAVLVRVSKTTAISERCQSDSVAGGSHRLTSATAIATALALACAVASQGHEVQSAKDLEMAPMTAFWALLAEVAVEEAVHCCRRRPVAAAAGGWDRIRARPRPSKRGRAALGEGILEWEQRPDSSGAQELCGHRTRG